MDFNQILSTYSNGLDITQRSNILSELTPLSEDELSSLQKIVNTYSSEEAEVAPIDPDFEEDDDETSEDNTPEPPAPTAFDPADIDPSVLDALSTLDESSDDFDDSALDDIPVENLDVPEEDNLEPVEEITAADFDELEEDNLEPIEEITAADFDEPEEDNLEPIEEITAADFEELEEDNLEPIEEITAADFDELEDPPIPNLNNLEEGDFEAVEDNGLDVDDFLTNFNEDDIESDFEDTTDEFFNDEIAIDDSLDAGGDNFDIELNEPEPELVPDEIIEDLQVPDFSNTEADITEPVPEEVVEAPLEAAYYESVDTSKQFDVWSDNKDDSSYQSVLHLTDEQIFSIRDSINDIKDKNLRFQIREIVIDPEAYGEKYNDLVSLILMNAPEQNIKNYLEKNIEGNGGDVLASTEPVAEIVSTFLAHDVADYQDSIQGIKDNIINNGKRFALYGVIAILTGTIAWIGIAQPLQVNSLFKKGLVAVQNDKFVEGEAYFQQGNYTAGEPQIDWFVRYADTYNQKGLIREAENKYLTALAFKPSDAFVATEASDFYTNLGLDYYTNAISIMKKVSDYHPNDFAVWDYQGSLLVLKAESFSNDAGKRTELLYEGADVYQKFIANNTKNPAPFYKMIDIYIRIGNPEQIAKIVAILNELNPEFINIEILTRLAKYYIDRRQLTEADRIFRSVTPTLDKYANNTPELAQLMKEHHHINPLSISNILGETYYEYARYKGLSSDVKMAAVLLTNSIYMNPANDKAYNLLGEVFLSQSNPVAYLAQAEKLFNTSLELNPQAYKPHINLGHLNYFWGEEFGDLEAAHDTALYHYRIAKATIPDNEKNYLLSYNLGWLEYQNNTSENAVELWSDIYKEDPSNPALSYALGSALFKIENPQLALVELEKTADALKLLQDKIPTPDLANRRHREVYTQLAKVYNNIGVINANYALSNPRRADYYDSQALLHFYNAKDIADRVNTIYNVTEYNIGVLTRNNIRNRTTEFDDNLPKYTSMENPRTEFNSLLLEEI